MKNVRFELSFCRFLKYDLTHQLLEFLKILVLMLCMRLLTSDCIFLVFQYVYHCELYHFSYIIAYLSFNIHQLLFPPFSYLLFGLFSTMNFSFTSDQIQTSWSGVPHVLPDVFKQLREHNVLKVDYYRYIILVKFN